MAVLAEHELEIIRKAMKVLALELREAGTLGDVRRFENLMQLRIYLNAIQFRKELDELVDVTDEALRDISDRLADAHEAAAGITIAAPTQAEVESFQQALRDLHDDIKNDERRQQASKFVESLAKVMEDRLADTG